MKRFILAALIALSVSSAFAQTVNTSGVIFKCRSTAKLSLTDEAKLFYDCDDQTLYVSTNGGAYTSLGSGGGGFAAQVANTVMAGPQVAPDATPTFRLLVEADIPTTFARKDIAQTFTVTPLFSEATEAILRVESADEYSWAEFGSSLENWYVGQLQGDGTLSIASDSGTADLNLDLGTGTVVVTGNITTLGLTSLTSDTTGSTLIAQARSGTVNDPTVIIKDNGQLANTFMLDVQAAGGTSKASIDKEGDIAGRNLTLSGTADVNDVQSVTGTIGDLTVTGTCTGCGGGSVPTGTGFRHVTAGAEDAAAALVVNADVDAAAAIAQSKIANLTSDLAAKAPLASPTFTGTVTLPSPFTLGATSVTTDGTELNYVDGVTSAIQTQLNGKAATSHNHAGSDITSGTVALANGGTGAALTDPNADRVLFWDDSAGAMTWLTMGTNLTITGTTLDAAGGGGGAPTDAKYIVQTADATLSNEQATGALATGILKNTTTTGVLSIAALADIPAPTGTGFARVTSGVWDAASTAETGTGSVVRAGSPTLTGTVSAAAISASAQVTGSPLSIANNTFLRSLGGNGVRQSNGANSQLYQLAYSMDSDNSPVNFVVSHWGWTTRGSTPVNYLQTTNGGTGLTANIALAPATNLVSIGLDAASPAAQTLQAQSSRAGTDSNVAGGNFVVQAGNGTGTGGSGSILLQTAPVGSTGTTANTMRSVVTIDKTGQTTFNVGRVMFAGTAPTAAVTGAGTTGAIAVDTGSTDHSGVLTITAGGSSLGTNGTATLTFTTGNGAFGTNPPTCDAWAVNGSGTTWQTGVNVIPNAATTTSAVFNWYNATLTGTLTAVTAASTYKIGYRCDAK